MRRGRETSKSETDMICKKQTCVMVSQFIDMESDTSMVDYRPIKYLKPDSINRP